jgi:signal recognition particle receptor subunit beta
MEWSILFAGPVGAGKTQAIRTISDIEVVGTEEGATDEVAQLKDNTTVAMDMGLMRLDGGDKVRLYGAPGQKRFDFMWDILLEQACGLVVLVDHSRPDPVGDMRFYLSQMHERMGGRLVPVVLGVTHIDFVERCDLNAYHAELQSHPSILGGAACPVLAVDARSRRDVRALLLALTAMLDISERFPWRLDSGRKLHA